MMQQILEMRQQMEAFKENFQSRVFSIKDVENEINVEIFGNKKIKDIQINSALLNEDRKEELEERLQIIINKAAEEADKTQEQELAKLTQNLFPGGLPGLF
jgi:DNA-binding protein YbaB